MVLSTLLDNPIQVGIFMSPTTKQEREGMSIQMGIIRSLGYCGIALEDPVTILYRSFENELEEQAELNRAAAN
jgi:hypothetical protein